MKTIKTLKHIEWASLGLHPGWWFTLGFPNLSTEGQIAWLELLTLAISTYPLGRVMFNNYNFMAYDLDLNLDEIALRSALHEATALGVVGYERIGTIITPKNHIFGRIDYAGLIRPELEGTLRAFGHEFSFPGIYTYGESLETGGWLVKEGPISQAQRRELEAVLEKPLELLRGRLPATDRTIDLDKPADDKAPLRPIDSARLDLFAWMSETLSGKSERVNLPELGN
jgi:hypothetical protein